MSPHHEDPLVEEMSLVRFMSVELSQERCEALIKEWGESIVESYGYDVNDMGKVEADVTIKVYPKPSYTKEDLL